MSLFRDQVQLTVKAGDGGNGRVSFRREKYIPKGGPDGGDGGKGGDVIITAVGNLMSLESLASKPRHAAEDGEMGGAAKCFGRDGADLVLEVPAGTLVKDAQRGNVLKDLDRVGASVVIAKGGYGGRGNARFATSTDRTPRRADPGLEGEQRTLKLELKIIADAGLVGFPNAGKSTLLGALSGTRPKVGAHPFTTLVPNIAIIERDFEPYVIADVPGLIEGAHQGKGLGDKFLRHVERTRVLLHLIDATVEGGVLAAWQAVRREIEAYSPELASRSELVVVTKIDEIDDLRRAEIDQELRQVGRVPHFVSALAEEGLQPLIDELVRRVNAARPSTPA